MMFRRPRLLRGKYFIINNHWCPGYYHWFTEAIPRLLTGIPAGYDLLLPDSFPGYTEKSIRCFYAGPIHRISKRNGYWVQYLWVPLNPPFSGVYDRFVLERIQDKVWKSVADNNRGAARIYVSRRDAPKRKIVNENEFTRCLLERNITTLQPEYLEFSEQVAMFKRTNLLVSIHGAGLTNMLWMKPGGCVLEIQKKVADSKDVDILYKDLANILGLRYFLMTAEPVYANASHYDADLKVNAEEFALTLDRLLEYTGQ